MRVVLLHGRIGAVEESPVARISQSNWVGWVLDTGNRDIPYGRAGLGGLAEKEAELLQALGEDVLARHGDGMADQNWRSKQLGGTKGRLIHRGDDSPGRP